MSIAILKPTNMQNGNWNHDGQYAPKLIENFHSPNFYGELLDNMGSGN